MNPLRLLPMLCLLHAPVVLAADLGRLSLDDADAIGLRLESDSTEKTEGRASLRITTAWPTTVCLGELVGVPVEGARLLYRAKVKSDLEGTAFLEIWAHVGGAAYFSKGMNDVVSQRTDWKTLQTPFLFERGQHPDKLTLNLVINGTGTVWVDDIVVSAEPLE